MKNFSARVRLSRAIPLLAVGMAITTLAACGSNSGGAAGTKCLTVDQVKKNGGWNLVLQHPQYPPYFFSDDSGKLKGMDVDLLDEVDKRLDTKIKKISHVPFSGVLVALSAKRSDFVPNGTGITPEREKTYAFGYPEGDNSNVVMTKDDSDVKTIEDLSGKRVGVETGSLAPGIAQQIDKELKGSKGSGFDSTKQYSAYSDLFLDLSNGRIDAAIAPVPPVSTYMQGHDGFASFGPAGDQLYAGWVYRKQDMGGKGCIGTEVNAAVRDLIEDGTLAKLQKKWFGKEMELPPLPSAGS